MDWSSDVISVQEITGGKGGVRASSSQRNEAWLALCQAQYEELSISVSQPSSRFLLMKVMMAL